MNFFFGIKNKNLLCKITIPKFQNCGNFTNDFNVYQAVAENNTWNIKGVECEQNKNFFFIENSYIENNKIFFLAKKEEVNLIKIENKLIELNNFTNTKPAAFRSNLRLSIPNKGFSSYQSEYPFAMSIRKGNILSPVSMLLNHNSDLNFIFFKNIYFQPKQDQANLYFINIKKKEIVDHVKIRCNFLNEIEVDKKNISKDIYMFTDGCLGIPLFVSIKDDHISFEHTHPPHHYILSDDRYKTIASVKNEFKKIINK